MLVVPSRQHNHNQSPDRFQAPRVGSRQDQHGNPRLSSPLLPLGPPSSLVSTTRLALSTSEPKPLAVPAGVCGGPIAAMLGSDLPTLRNPAPAIGVIAATESEFDPLHPPDQPASESATPRHGRSCFAADRPLVALHQDQEASTQRIVRISFNLCLRLQPTQTDPVFSALARPRAVPPPWFTRLP
jgi:hypothetical protein